MTTAELDFPPIEAPPAAAPAPVAIIAPSTVAAVTPSIKDTVLRQFKDAEGAILALAEKYRAVAFDVSTTKGMNEAKAARLELREKGRFAVQRAETSVKADVNGLKRVMADEVERLVAIVQPVEDAIDAQIKAREKELADEKAERERIEAERVAAHRERLANIPAYLTHCQQPGMTAARIAAGIAQLEKVTFGPDWQEFAVPAANAQRETLEAMRKLQAAAVEREAETLRLEAQREEQARVAEQQAQAARELAQQQAEFARQQQEAAANVARMNALQARIAEIHAAATGHERASAADLGEAIMAVQALHTGESAFQEFAQTAGAAQVATLHTLQGLYAAARDREDAAARVAAQQAEAAAAELAALGGQAERLEALAEENRAALLLQDVDAGLSSALAEAPRAHQHAVEAAAAITDSQIEPEPGDTFCTENLSIESLRVVLAACRHSLTEACALLDELICKPPTKKDAPRLFARVAELRDLGGLPRATTTTAAGRSGV